MTVKVNINGIDTEVTLSQAEEDRLRAELKKGSQNEYSLLDMVCELSYVARRTLFDTTDLTDDEECDFENDLIEYINDYIEDVEFPMADLFKLLTQDVEPFKNYGEDKLAEIRNNRELYYEIEFEVTRKGKMFIKADSSTDAEDIFNELIMDDLENYIDDSDTEIEISYQDDTGCSEDDLSHFDKCLIYEG